MGVEAYVVKGMEANLLIGEDTQLAWQLHTIQPDSKQHWKVRDLTHPMQGPVQPEAFTASCSVAVTSTQLNFNSTSVHYVARVGVKSRDFDSTFDSS
jgi:hypothetical protein